MRSQDHALPSLRVYLEGMVDFDAALQFQHLLVEQVARQERSAALFLCEHRDIITVGRDGGPADILCDENELRARRWRVRWVNRAGGSLLHVAGQLALYPVLPLERLDLGIGDHL